MSFNQKLFSALFLNVLLFLQVIPTLAAQPVDKASATLKIAELKNWLTWANDNPAKITLNDMDNFKTLLSNLVGLKIAVLDQKEFDGLIAQTAKNQPKLSKDGLLIFEIIFGFKGKINIFSAPDDVFDKLENIIEVIKNPAAAPAKLAMPATPKAPAILPIPVAPPVPVKPQIIPVPAAPATPPRPAKLPPAILSIPAAPPAPAKAPTILPIPVAPPVPVKPQIIPIPAASATPPGPAKLPPAILPIPAAPPTPARPSLVVPMIPPKK